MVTLPEADEKGSKGSGPQMGARFVAVGFHTGQKAVPHVVDRNGMLEDAV